MSFVANESFAVQVSVFYESDLPIAFVYCRFNIPFRPCFSVSAIQPGPKKQGLLFEFLKYIFIYLLYTPASSNTLIIKQGLYCNRLRHHITAVLAGVYCSTTKNARRLPDLVKVGICPDNLHKPRHMLNGLG